MFKRLTSRILLISALWMCALAAPVQARHATHAHAHANPVPPLGGVNIPAVYPGASAASVEREIKVADALHAKAVRVEIPWSALEPLGAGQIDPVALGATDSLVSDAAAYGIRVIMMVDNTPCWASTAPTPLLGQCVPGQASQANSWPPHNPSDYAAFVAFLAQRYGTRLAAIEVWNEPDQVNEAYFAGPNKAQLYAALLRAAYPAIKQADPQLPVLGGSFVGSNGLFLKALYAAGIKGYYDGLAVHFYTLTLAALRATHEVQLANGDDKPLWLNEFGWPSCWPQSIEEEQACVTDKTQAENLTNTVRALARTPYVAAEIVYKLQSSNLEEFGALSATGEEKPAFAALSSVLGSPFGNVSPATLKLSRKGASLVASGSGPVGDYMALEAFRGKVLRYQAFFTLDSFNRYSITLPAALGNRHLRVRVYQYWSGPGKSTQKSV